MHTRVLVTGFEPFGGETVDPALEAVKRLEGRTLETSEGRIQLFTKAIPTVFGRSVEVLDKAIEEARPDVVICVGQAGGRHHITPERVAINVDDARIPDNEGQQPVDTPIVAGGPAAYSDCLACEAHRAIAAGRRRPGVRIEYGRYLRVQPHLSRADASA